MYLFFFSLGNMRNGQQYCQCTLTKKKMLQFLCNCYLMGLILYKDVVSIPFFVLGSVAEPDERFVDFDLISCIELYVITFIKFFFFPLCSLNCKEHNFNKKLKLLHSIKNFFILLSVQRTSKFLSGLINFFM